jgi:hypothetical protein
VHLDAIQPSLKPAAPKEAQKKLPREVLSRRGPEEDRPEHGEGGYSERGTPRQAGEPSDHARSV